MIDVGAAFEVLLDIAREPNPVQAVSDAKFVYELSQAPAELKTALSADKMKTVTGPLARTTALLDKLANDPARAPHVVALLQSLTT